jgi:hypothetical protein
VVASSLRHRKLISRSDNLGFKRLNCYLIFSISGEEEGSSHPNLIFFGPQMPGTFKNFLLSLVTSFKKYKNRKKEDKISCFFARFLCYLLTAL